MELTFIQKIMVNRQAKGGMSWEVFLGKVKTIQREEVSKL